MEKSNESKSYTFNKILQELATLANVPNLAKPADHAQIEVDGVYFTVIEGGAYDQATLSYFCDFGPIPVTSERADILQRLLEANLLMFGMETPSFAVNFETSHVLLMGQAHLAEIDAQRMLNAFVQYSTQAKLWRQTYFLDDQKRASSIYQHRLHTAMKNQKQS